MAELNGLLLPLRMRGCGGERERECVRTCACRELEESMFPVLGGCPCVGSGSLLSACRLTVQRVSYSAGVPPHWLPSQCPHLDLLELFIPTSVFMTSRDLVEPLGNESGQ